MVWQEFPQRVKEDSLVITPIESTGMTVQHLLDSLRVVSAEAADHILEFIREHDCGMEICLATAAFPIITAADTIAVDLLMKGKQGEQPAKLAEFRTELYAIAVREGLIGVKAPLPAVVPGLPIDIGIKVGSDTRLVGMVAEEEQPLERYMDNALSEISKGSQHAYESYSIHPLDSWRVTAIHVDRLGLISRIDFEGVNKPD